MAVTTTQTKSMGYDHPSYTTRQTFDTRTAAGNAGVSDKLVAHSNLVLYGLTASTLTAGTSTYTGGLFGQPAGATLAVASTQLSLIVITNTAAAGATIGLSTTTVGPYTMGGVFNGAGNTATNQVGATCYFPFNTSSLTGGLAVAQGSQFYVVNGTDTSAVMSLQIDYDIAPLGSVVA